MSVHVFSVPSGVEVGVDVSGRAYTADTLHESAAMLCRGRLNQAYFTLLDHPISEFIYHQEIFLAVNERLRPKTENAPQAYGDDLDFE